MTISALTSTSAASTSTASTATSSLTAADFLTLLLTELQNQDPTDPMDTSSMISQFSSLTQVQLAQENTSYLQSLQQTTAVDYIGKTISYSGSSSDEVSVASGTAGTSTFTLADDASTVTATIYDANGTAVKTCNLGSMSAGSNSFQWDGTNRSGTTVADGTYTVSYSATDSSGSSVSATTEKTATVTGVVYSDGITYLVTDAGKIPLSSVTGVT
jgi:flagellar basal-body rod modification protein FlgD